MTLWGALEQSAYGVWLSGCHQAVQLLAAILHQDLVGILARPLGPTLLLALVIGGRPANTPAAVTSQPPRQLFSQRLPGRIAVGSQDDTHGLVKHRAAVPQVGKLGLLLRRRQCALPHAARPALHAQAGPAFRDAAGIQQPDSQ